MKNLIKLPVLIIFILIVIIVNGILYLYQGNIKTKCNDDINNQRLLIDNQQAKIDELEKNNDSYKNKFSQYSPYSLISVSPAKKSNWLTYTNSKNKFKIDFPDDYILVLSDEINGSILLRSKEKQSELDQDKIVRTFDTMIMVFDSPNDFYNNENNDLTFEEWINKKADEYGFIERKSILIDGIKGYSGVSNSMIYGNYMQFIEYNGKLYQMENDSSGVQGEILKSFRFIK